LRVQLFIISVFLVLNTAQLMHGAMLFESSVLGPTGITKDQVLAQDAPALNVASFNFVGARFELVETSVVTRIGGHFVGGFVDSSFFGSIAKLDNENDFPNSGDFLTPDVVAIAILSFPNPSAEAYGATSTVLEPGWYAVIFGSQLFGATGRGAILRNGANIGAPSYFHWQPSNGWFEFDPVFGDMRLVVEGYPIAEPNGALFAGLCAFGWVIARRAWNTRGREGCRWSLAIQRV
jgi:hypothetical protein